MALDTYTQHRLKFRSRVVNSYAQANPITDAMATVEYGPGGDGSFADMGTSTASNVAPGATLAENGETLASVDIALENTIRDHKWVPTEQDEDVPDMKYADANGRYAKRLGQSVGRGVGERFLALLAGSSGTQVVNDYTTVSTLKGNVEAGIRTAFATLMTAGVPEVDLYGCLYPTLYASLFGTDNPITSKDIGGEGSIARPGLQQWYMNVMFKPTALAIGQNLSAASHLLTKYKGDFTNVVGVIWHQDAVGVRKLTRNPVGRVHYHDENNAWLLQGGQRLGTGILQVDGIILLVDNV